MAWKCLSMALKKWCNAQYSQIENCISMGVKGHDRDGAGSIENVIPAVEEAKKAGIR